MTGQTALKTGKRVVISEFSESPLDNIDSLLSIENQPFPDVSQLKSTDVVIDVKSASVGWVDLIMTSGQYQHMPSPPYTPGLEYSGVVAWKGDDVDDSAFRVGDAVLVDGFQVGPRSLGDYQQYGGFASYSVAPSTAVHAIPDGFSFDQACNLLGSYETAYHCLIARANLQPGETVLIHGASGATGLAAVHIAKLIGATVIATGRSDEKLAVVKEQGADHVVNCAMPDGASGVRKFRDDVKALTGGRGADVVYDGVGGDITVESMRCVNFDARFLIVGWASTPTVAKGKGGRGAPNANMIPTNLIMMKGLQVLGSPMVISTVHNPEIRKARFAQIMEWVAGGQIKPHISHSYDLADVKQAMQDKWSGKIIGGCSLHPPQG